MRFFEVVISGAALIAAAWAVELNDVPSSIEAGKTYTITYSPKDNTPTEIILRKGDPNDLGTIATLTTTATGGSFQWTVDSALPNAEDYALEIKQAGAEPNYSGLIPLTGGSDAESSAASSGTPSPTSPTAASSTGSASETSKASQATTLFTTTATGASASVTVSSSASNNGTVTSATLSATSTGSEPSSTGADETSTGPPTESTGGAATLGSSPLALIFGAVAAMVYLN